MRDRCICLFVYLFVCVYVCVYVCVCMGKTTLQTPDVGVSGPVKIWFCQIFQKVLHKIEKMLVH